MGTHPKRMQEGSKVRDMCRRTRHQGLPQGQGRQMYKLRKRTQSMAEDGVQNLPGVPGSY